MSYSIVAEYPHNPDNFVEGFLAEGNTVYESDGLAGASQLIKYTWAQLLPVLSKNSLLISFPKDVPLLVIKSIS